MATKIEAFRSEDGCIFECKIEAEQRDSKIAFGRWYPDSPVGLIVHDEFTPVPQEDVWIWLQENKAYLLYFFGIKS